MHFFGQREMHRRLALLTADHINEKAHNILNMFSRQFVMRAMQHAPLRG